MRLSLLTLLGTSLLWLSACGGGGSELPPLDLQVRGTVSYDFVPQKNGGGLDYAATEVRAVKGASVILMGGNQEILASSKTDENGRYVFNVKENTQVQVNVLAELKQAGNSSWDVRVTDNTQSNRVYALQGALVSIGSADQTRDLHADSGWTGDRYGASRSAAPFAILDTLHETVTKMTEVDSRLQLPAFEVRWSPNNISVPGDKSLGNIGTSHFDDRNIYILGHEDNDTDEYDQSVIVHEFTHYLESALSRTDSIGGPHSLTTITDFRVAFSEGLANAMAGILNGDGLYHDAFQTGQSTGFTYSLESNDVGNLGWFSENSVGQIIYDIYDDIDTDNDGIALGLSAIYDTLTSDEYKSSPAQSSIYLFSDVLKAQQSTNTAAAIDELLERFDIYGKGAFGVGESNDADTAYTLPVYHELAPGQTLELCGNNALGQVNGLDVRRFVVISILEEGDYTIRTVKTSGEGNRDPELRLFLNAELIGAYKTSAINEEQSPPLSLSPGRYILELYDYNNIAPTLPGGPSCFNVSI